VSVSIDLLSGCVSDKKQTKESVQEAEKQMGKSIKTDSDTMN
jgi:hypothetical protein